MNAELPATATAAAAGTPAPAPDLPETAASPPDAVAEVDTAIVATDTPADSTTDTPADTSADSAAPIPALSPAACAARMATLFPAVFSPGAAKPLKLRIQADIQQRSPGVFTRKVLSLFLQRHTTSTAYLRALAKQPQRVDLDGQPAGEVSDEHREAAAAEVNRRHAMHEERRAAERLAQRKAHEEARREYAAQDEARRNRAGLLRAYETTTLTRGNFCALKKLPEAELDALLSLARQEREQAPPPAAAPERFAQRPADRDRERAAPRPGERERRPAHPRGPQRHPGVRPKPGP